MRIFIKFYNLFYVFFLKIRYYERLTIKGSIRSNGFFKIHVARGAKCIIQGDVILQSGVILAVRKNAVLEIGKNCFFNRHCSIICREKIVIKAECFFGEAVKIYDHDHKISKKGIARAEFISSPIYIEQGCWLANGVNILKGSMLPQLSVIGAMSLVNSKLEKSGIYAGIPVKLRKEMTEV